jgi:hypothetical protein
VKGAKYTDFAFVHISTPNGNPWSQWTVNYLFPAGRINLQADTGLYLARCHNCGTGSYPDSAGVHASRVDDPWAIWTV